MRLTLGSILGVLTAAIGFAFADDPPAKPKAEPPADSKQEAAKKEAAQAAKWLKEAFKDQPTPEAAEMLIAIANGSKMGPGEGWFHSGQSRYGWKWLAEKHGVKTNESIPRDKFLGSEALFDRLDRNKDGMLKADDFDWSDRNMYAMQSNTIGFWFRTVNKSHDCRITREEWIKFFEEAAHGKDRLTIDDMRDAVLAANAPKGDVPDEPTPEVLVRGLFRREIGSMNEGPKLNDPAPDFTLKSHDGKQTFRLSDQIGKKPIVLVFGNVTCGPFRSIYPRVDDLAIRYKDDAVFFCVYVREAHPTDGWRMGSNDAAGVTFAQPKDYAERCTLANGCMTKLKMNMPLLVDEMDDRVGNAYSGMPARLYLIDRDGSIAYKSGRGPFGFKPDEMEQSLVMLLLDQQKRPAQGRVPLLTDADAWKRLPSAEKGSGEPLPAWARALADALPRTTAAMLELDYLHRAQSPLDPSLRGKLRWVAAHANRCAFGEAYAAADLRRAGVDDAAIKVLSGDLSDLPEKERAALKFAQKLTLAADSVADEEVAQLIKLYGDKQVVAMVLLLAYANFQDRLLLTLAIPVEEGGPRPPFDVRFAKGGDVPEAAPRQAPKEGTIASPEKPRMERWGKLDFSELQDRMERQRQGPGRIAVPTWEDVLKGLPSDYPTNKSSRVKWSLVCLGYQPELSAAWLGCMRTFAQESKQDRVFEESLFWVITRSVSCYY
jgi:alkylhydroperoxidase family enzyme